MFFHTIALKRDIPEINCKYLIFCNPLSFKNTILGKMPRNCSSSLFKYIIDHRKSSGPDN